MTTLRDQIKAVAECRARELECAEIVDAERRRFEEDNRAILDALSAAGQSRTEAETQLRRSIVAEYQATGNKKPAPGCGIREVTSYEYPSALAFDWAKTHELALSLDAKAFRDLCKADSTKPDFVEVRVEPQATIASDLTEAVVEITVLEAA